MECRGGQLSLEIDKSYFQGAVNLLEIEMRMLTDPVFGDVIQQVRTSTKDNGKRLCHHGDACRQNGKEEYVAPQQRLQRAAHM